MSATIIRRANPAKPFGFHPKRGSVARPERTVDLSTAARLGVSGKVNEKDGKPVSVTVSATEAKPRTLVLSNVLKLTASNPTGTMPKSGYAVPFDHLVETLTINGWLSVLNLFPADGTDPTAEARSKVDPEESTAFANYLRTAEEIEVSGTAETDSL